MFEKLGTMSRGTFLLLLNVSAASGLVAYRWTEPRYEVRCNATDCVRVNRFTGDAQWIMNTNLRTECPPEDAEARWNRARAEGWAEEQFHYGQQRTFDPRTGRSWRKQEVPAGEN